MQQGIHPQDRLKVCKLQFTYFFLAMSQRTIGTRKFCSSMVALGIQYVAQAAHQDP